VAKEKYQKKGHPFERVMLKRDFPHMLFFLRAGQKLGPDYIRASNSLPLIPAEKTHIQLRSKWDRKIALGLL